MAIETVFLLQYLFFSSLSMLLREAHGAPFHILNFLHTEILKQEQRVKEVLLQWDFLVSMPTRKLVLGERPGIFI